MYVPTNPAEMHADGSSHLVVMARSVKLKLNYKLDGNEWLEERERKQMMTSEKGNYNCQMTK